MTEKKKPAHYVDNKEFLRELIEFREENRERVEAGQRPHISNSIGKKILDICDHLSYRYNFINYPYREEMVSDAVVTCIRYIWSFDPDKSKYPFAYFTKIAYRDMVKRIKKEHKQLEIKIKYTEQSRITHDDVINDDTISEIMGTKEDTLDDFM